MAGEAAAAVGLGALAEEEYSTRRVNELVQSYRKLQELRWRILQDAEKEADGEDVAEFVSKIAAVIRRYAHQIDEVLAEFRTLGIDPLAANLESVIEEYAEVLQLDVPVGGGKTLGDLLYEGQDEVLDRLHEIMMALFMKYVEINKLCGHRCPPEAKQKLEKLATLELATYIIYNLFRKQKIDKNVLIKLLEETVDEILST